MNRQTVQLFDHPPADSRRGIKQGFRMIRLQLEPVHLVQGHGGISGSVDFIGERQKQVSAGQRKILPAGMKLNVSLNQIGKLKTVFVVMHGQGRLGMGSCVDPDHPQTGDSVFVISQNHLILCFQIFVIGLIRLTVHSGSLLNLDFVLNTL